jgi:hypothetical protein
MMTQNTGDGKTKACAVKGIRIRKKEMNCIFINREVEQSEGTSEAPTFCQNKVNIQYSRGMIHSVLYRHYGRLLMRIPS